MKFVLLTGGLVVVLVVAMLFALAYQSRRSPPLLGVVEGTLTPCPSSPNCVCSDDRDELHGLPMWTVTGPDSWEMILAVVASQPGARIVEQSPTYSRAEISSRLFGFVDDLELHLRGEKVAVRSASRVGYSDFGANRKRVEELGDLFKSVQLIH